VIRGRNALFHINPDQLSAVGREQHAPMVDMNRKCPKRLPKLIWVSGEAEYFLERGWTGE
jgi:hypothetical protein